jgi:DNA invertase Pin-like site-specific DNA recombinase
LEKPQFVLYRRISTQSQAISGLGLDAQMNEIQTYLENQHDHCVIADLVEVESGKDDQNRPVLQEALSLASKAGAVILVSRLCRLSRDLEFVAGLMKRQVGFRIATNPTADEFTIGIYALIGMHERKEIGRRTAQALQAAKKRGVRLGTAGSRNIKKANDAKISAAKTFAAKLQPLVMPLREAGKTFQEIADILNSMGMQTPQGKSFHPSSVRNYMTRLI